MESEGGSPIKQNPNSLNSILNRLDAVSQQDASQQKPTVDTASVVEGRSFTVRQYEDENNMQRSLYTFYTREGHPVEVSFFSPVESTFSSEIVRGRQGFILGEGLKHVSLKEWLDFKSKVMDASERPMDPLNTPHTLRSESITQGKAVYFVESSPTALLDLAFTLGVEGHELREARKLLSERRTNSTTIALIDKLVAAKLYSDDESHNFDTSANAEALLIAALQGESKANVSINQRLDAMRKNDAQIRQEFLERTSASESESQRYEPLKLEDLVAVHLTRFPPKREGGQFVMRSTFDGTNWTIPRNTVHFSLNHAVQSHMYGGWEDAPYAVISPLGKMIEANGVPTVLNTVDTFFEMEPGKRINLPEGTVMVMPGLVPEGKLIQEGSNGLIFYKTKGITPADVALLTKDLDKHARDFLNSEIARVVANGELLNSYEWSDGPVVLTNDELVKLQGSLGVHSKPLDLISLLSSNDIPLTLSRIFSDAGFSDRLSEENINALTKSLQGVFIDRIKRKAINEQIRKMGFTVKPGGMWAWGSDAGVTSQTRMLAQSLGTETVAHSNHPTSEVEDEFIGPQGLMNLLSEGQITPAEFRQSAHQYITKNMRLVSPPARRMLYLAGAL